MREIGLDQLRAVDACETLRVNAGIVRGEYQLDDKPGVTIEVATALNSFT